MRIEHAALYVCDLQGAKAFFEKYLGATAGDEYYNPKKQFKSYFLSFDGGARLELMWKQGIDDAPKDRERTGYAHISFCLGSKEEVDRLTARLKDDGYEVISGPRTTGDGYYESSIVAIEGNIIELTV